MLADSDADFGLNQRSTAAVYVIEDGINKTKYYETVTKYRGEISLIREEERNGVFYKSLIYGWKLDNTMPKEVREEAEAVRKATLQIIDEKEKAGCKSFKVKTLDSCMRTELRDPMGNRILEIAESQSYFHLIIFGNKWRTDPVDGLYSDFTIKNILDLQDRKRASK